MIEFKDPEYFLGVLKWAAEHDCAGKLAERLSYLATYGIGDNTCEIHRDFAPHSFGFCMKRPDGSCWFFGGLIYSGPGQPLDGSAPALTVRIGANGSQHNWSVHT